MKKESKISKAKKYLRKIKLEIVLIFLVVALGAFLRLYHIELFGFANDQARDANIAQGILKSDFPLEGPQFSVDTTGDRGHLGPIYYYLIAPVYFIFNGDPIGNVIFLPRPESFRRSFYLFRIM